MVFLKVIFRDAGSGTGMTRTYWVSFVIPAKAEIQNTRLPMPSKPLNPAKIIVP
jgi:hypothetical protein